MKMISSWTGLDLDWVGYENYREANLSPIYKIHYIWTGAPIYRAKPLSRPEHRDTNVVHNFHSLGPKHTDGDDQASIMSMMITISVCAPLMVIIKT